MKTPNNNPFQFIQDLADGKTVKPTWSHESLKRQLEDEEIDENDFQFLSNLLKESIGDLNVLREVFVFRNRLAHGLKPGQERFIQMQELGCRNYPLTDLDISGYELPEILLANGEIGGSLLMSNTHVRRSVDMHMAQIGESVEQGGAQIKGCVDQSEAEIEKDVYQVKAVIGENVDQTKAKIGGSVFQTGSKIGGDVNQRDAEIGGNLDQADAEIRRDVYQMLIKIKRDLIQTDLKIKGAMDQQGAQIGGRIHPKTKEAVDWFNRLFGKG